MSHQVCTNSNAVEDAPIPDSEQLRRLALDAAGYLFVDAGATIHVDELREQAYANGYTKSEFRDFLDDDGLTGATRVTVPERDGEFGDLWRVDGTDDACGDAGPGTLSRRVEACREWYEQKSNESHAYSRQKATRRFARWKDVERYFVDEYDEFSTVMLTFCAGFAESPDEIVEHHKRFFPRAVSRKLRGVLQDLDVYDEYAGVKIYAPKSPSGVPGPAVPSSHPHVALLIPGRVSPEAFAPVIDKHVSAVDGATSEAHPVDEAGDDGAVTVQHHRSDDVRTPDSVLAKGSGLDEERGHTTSLSQEVGDNLPLLRAESDARGTAEYVEKWCAALRHGTDGSLDSRGVSRWQPMKNGRTTCRFREIADERKYRRRLMQGHENATALVSDIGVPGASAPRLDQSDTPVSEPDSSVGQSDRGPKPVDRVPGSAAPQSSSDDSPDTSCSSAESDGSESGEESRFTFTETGES